jgi:hypothetical protein
MPVHVDEMSSEVTVLDKNLPLSPEQIEQLVRIVLQRLEQQQRDERRTRESNSVHRSVIPRQTTRQER